MDTNKLCTALSHLKNDWIKRVLEDCEHERNEFGPSGIKLLQKEGRRAIWGICKLFGAEVDGVPGRACRLLERYLYKYITNYFSHVEDDEQRRNFKKELFARLPLVLASCAQLSAKMSSSNAKVNANHVRAGLRKLNLEYSIQEINTDVFHVFSTLGFHIPLWTGVEEGQLFALEIGMSKYMLESVAVIINAAEFARDIIEQRVRGIASDSPGSFEDRPMQSLHLVVGAVAASARCMAFVGSDPVQRLADATNLPHSFIGCIADVILTELILDSPTAEAEYSLFKRKKL